MEKYYLRADIFSWEHLGSRRYNELRRFKIKSLFCFTAALEKFLPK